jgi:hypothetical protein
MEETGEWRLNIDIRATAVGDLALILERLLGKTLPLDLFS